MLTAHLGLLVRAHARDRPQPPARAERGRALERVPAAGDAADRVRGARLPGRLGLEGLPAHRKDRRAHASARPGRVRPPARADLHALDQGASSATTRRSTAPAASSWWARSATTGSRQSRSSSTASPRAYAAERGILLADTQVRARARPERRARARRRAVHARLLALLARGRLPPRRPAALLRQAAGQRLDRGHGLGQDLPRARSCPRRSSPRRGRATSRPSSG